ncbi:hypothetical protein UR09_00090 [Candidatus Nitromaritima sp. SCGC AAA799-A02]|nr:hypothetical protein UZ36_00090 [Candidatus Nitromaritima sp. SCGC AAA799-C22]KMP12729.1 hypothetical protein UR09_00090 [Candidatus Nitromaritima sp. SCGC AAA799-A02]
MRDFLKNNLIVLFLLNSASFFNYLFQFALGHSLSAAGFGSFNALNSLLAILGAPVSIIHIIFSRFIVKLSVSSMGQVKSLFKKSFQIIISIVAVIFIAGLLLIPWFKSFLHINETIPIVLMLISLGLSLLFPICFGMLEGLHRFLLFGIGSSGFTITRFIGALLLVTFLGLGVNGALLAGAIASCLALIFGFWSLRDIIKTPEENLHPDLWGEMVHFSMPVFLSTMMVMFLWNIDIVLVKHYCSEYESGLYATAAILGRIAFALPSTLLTVLFPSAAKIHAMGKKDDYILWTSLGLTMVLAGSVALLFYFWPEQFIGLLFGEKFTEAAPLLQIISIAMALLATSNVIFSYCLARSEFSYIWFLGAGVLLILLLIILFHDSAMTIAIVLLFSVASIFVGTLIWLFFNLKRSASMASNTKTLES